MNLLDAPKEKKFCVLSYKGGKGVSLKLRQLGIMPGRMIKVLRYAPLGGPVMIDVDGRSVAVGRGIAAHILIEEAECE